MFKRGDIVEYVGTAFRDKTRTEKMIGVALNTNEDGVLVDFAFRKRFVESDLVLIKSKAEQDLEFRQRAANLRLAALKQWQPWAVDEIARMEMAVASVT